MSFPLNLRKDSPIINNGIISFTSVLHSSNYLKKMKSKGLKYMTL